tara:strand:+ start:490 stop:1437 length:948 start_codon:yes stop_codon:yes gene_type:complete
MIEQGSQAWHDQRTNRLTGTRIAKAAKEDIWTSGDQWDALGRDMYREAHRLTQDPFDSRAMFAITHGKDSEPVALACLEKMGYKITQPSFVIHPDYNWLGMSPDGIMLKGRNGKVSAVEVKCPQAKPCSNVKEQKRNYWHQMQLGMACMDIDEMLFFQWYSDEEHYQEWVPRDPRWAEIYIPKGKEFMDWYLEAMKQPENIARWSEGKEEPGVNYKKVEECKASLQLAGTLKELGDLKQKIGLLEDRKKELSALLIKQHGGSFSTSSVKGHMTHAKGRINYSRFVKDQKIEQDILEGYRSEGDSRIYTKLVEEKE